MNELEFRAWIPRLRQFYVWGFGVDNNGSFFTAPPSDVTAISQQYIGSRDKDGSKIYVGDIVTHPLCVKEPHDAKEPCENFVGLIQYEADRGQYFAVNRKRNGYVIAMTEAYKFKIIGNIFESPELLVEKK